MVLSGLPYESLSLAPLFLRSMRPKLEVERLGDVAGGGLALGSSSAFRCFVSVGFITGHLRLVCGLMRANLVAALLADRVTHPDLPRLSWNSAMRRQNLASKSRQMAGGLCVDESRVGTVVGIVLRGPGGRSEVVDEQADKNP